MKLISLLLAVYFFSLAIIPCGDTGECDQASQTTNFQIQNHSEHQHENENCSPICICNCCGSVTVVSNFNNNIIAQISTEEISTYNQNSLSGISFSIWQPPKLS